MTAAITLSLYVVRQFALSVIGMLLALAGLVAMLPKSADAAETFFQTDAAFWFDCFITHS